MACSVPGSNTALAITGGRSALTLEISPTRTTLRELSARRPMPRPDGPDLRASGMPLKPREMSGAVVPAIGVPSWLMLTVPALASALAFVIACEIIRQPPYLVSIPTLMATMGNTVLIATLALFSLGRLTGFFTDPRLKAGDIHKIVGNPAVAAPAMIPNRLNVISWNIERGVRFGGVLDTLQKLDADVVLLQEVDRYCGRSGGRDVAADLASALGMNWVAAGEFQEIGEATKGRAALHGQAILSRYPITDAGVLVFAEQASLRWRLNPVQPRRGGRMALRARTGGMLVYTAHLESGSNETLRRKQLDEMVRDQQREARPDERVVLAGDFNNSPVAHSSMFRGIGAARFVDSHGGTARLTSINSSHPIDWIFVKNLAFLDSSVYMVKGVSDHFPVLASVTTVQVVADPGR
jgi:endonuclease/exonuclease/phosphatase family metal-dependent hydrolase